MSNVYHKKNQGTIIPTTCKSTKLPTCGIPNLRKRYNISVPKKERGTSLKPPSTTPAETKGNTNPLYQTYQHLKVSANQSISNESYILAGINTKDRIGNLGIMCSRMYATYHSTKPLLQSFSTEGYPVKCGPAWYTEQTVASILHAPHMSANSTDDRTVLCSEEHTKVHKEFANIIKYKTIKGRIPPTLKVSPEACIPHKICE